MACTIGSVVGLGAVKGVARWIGDRRAARVRVEQAPSARSRPQLLECAVRRNCVEPCALDATRRAAFDKAHERALYGIVRKIGITGESHEISKKRLRMLIEASLDVIHRSENNAEAKYARA